MLTSTTGSRFVQRTCKRVGGPPSSMYSKDWTDTVAIAWWTLKKTLCDACRLIVVEASSLMKSPGSALISDRSFTGMAALQQGPRLGQLPSISSATCICTSVLLNSPSQSFFPLPASHMTSAAFQPHLSVACSQPAFSQIPAQGQPLRFHRSIGVTALGRASVTCLSAKGESSSHALPENPRAALLIIGNEILTGKIQDTNTATLGRAVVQCFPYCMT